MPLKPPRPRAFAARSLLLFGFWLLLLEPDSLAPADVGADWVVGAFAALAAGLLSLRLWPPSGGGVRFVPLVRFVLRFLVQSLLGGLSVARLAFDPRLPLDPGLIAQPTALRRGTCRALFGALTSQVPGTLAVGLDDPGRLLYHCLDQGQDMGALTADEVLFLRVLEGCDAANRQPGP